MIRKTLYSFILLLLGSLASAHGVDGRWWFAAGAGLGSIVWFTALGWGGTKLAPSVDSARTWRIVDAVVGVLMLGIAVKVGLTLL